MHAVPVEMDRRGAGGELGHSCPPDLPDGWMEVVGSGMGSDLCVVTPHEEGNCL